MLVGLWPFVKCSQVLHVLLGDASSQAGIAATRVVASLVCVNLTSLEDQLMASPRRGIVTRSRGLSGTEARNRRIPLAPDVSNHQTLRAPTVFESFGMLCCCSCKSAVPQFAGKTAP